MSEWKTVRLGDVCEIARGGSPRPINDYITTDENGINWIKIGDTSSDSKYIERTEQKIKPEGMKKSRYVHSGDFILSNSMSFGRPYILKIDGCIHDGWLVLQNIQNDIDKDYLYCVLSSPSAYHQFEKMAVGGVVNNLNSDKVKELIFPLPPLEKQKQIAKILDKCNILIIKHKQMVEKYDALIKSRFIEMFGDIIQNTKNWELKSFTEIAKSRLGKMLDKKKQTGKEKYPYLANFNVQWFRFNLENLNEMDFSEADRIEFALKDGDLLVCEGGEVGRCAVWHNQIKNCFFQKAVHRVRLNMDLVHPDYMAYWFKFRSDFNSFDDIVGSKATIAHLTGEKLKLLQIPVPPLSLQNNFASFVQQIDKSKFVVQKSLEKAETLYKSLMQEYFG